MSWSALGTGIYLACSFFLFLLGMVILRENFRSRVNRTTALMLFFGGLGALFAAVGTTLARTGGLAPGSETESWYNLFYLWELFFPALLLFALVFPKETDAVRRFRLLRYAIFLPHLFHVFWVSFLSSPEKLSGWFSVEEMGPLARVLLSPFSYVLRVAALFFAVAYKFHVRFFSLVNFSYAAMAIALLFFRQASLPNPRIKSQVRLILSGLGLAMTLYTIAFILPALFGFSLSDPWLYALTIGALVIGCGAVGWAILRYQFMDVRVIFRQNLVYFLSTGLLVAVYILAAAQLGRYIRNTLGAKTPALEIGFILLALVFFQPVMEKLDDLIKRLFIRQRSDFRNLLERFSRELVSIFDLNQISARVTELLEKELFIERAVLLLAESDAGGTLVTFSSGNEVLAQSVSGEDPLLKILLSRKQPTYLEAVWPERPDEGLARLLAGVGAKVAVPILDEGRFVGILALGEKFSGFRYSPEDITLLGVLANQLSIATANARLYAETLEKQRLEEELAMARQIQQNLLPARLPSSAEYEFASYVRPSRQVGGDFYDFLWRENQLGFVLADASGKGMPAALLVSFLQATMKAEHRYARPIGEFISSINELLVAHTSPEKFVTLFYALFDPREKKLFYSNAGHNYPILVRQDGHLEFLKKGGTVVGCFEWARYESDCMPLLPGDTLIVYSDGLTDASNHDEMFGEERLIKLAAECCHLDAEGVKNRIVEAVEAFTGPVPPFDDMTLLVMKAR
ncbi:MAG: SpoIIE family protein phosphatase [candidate division Zixibacteria bacterium]|nr:SpoIIE family protein phosphatase [candidate division Zixibacteria bacterium]